MRSYVFQMGSIIFIFFTIIMIGTPYIYFNIHFSNNELKKEYIEPYYNILESSDLTLESNANKIVTRGDEVVKFQNVSNIVNITALISDSFAWGDYNNDGNLDFLCRGNTTIGTRLFENSGEPDWKFKDVSIQANITGNIYNPNRGYPIWGDYNNDGNLDFFIAGDNDKLFKNTGAPNWTFEDVTFVAGNLNDSRPSEAAAWGDFDRDGYIDLYVNSWRDAQNRKFNDVLWHNNGDGTFTDVSTQAGIYSSTTPNYEPPPFAGMGVAWGDYNNDGWLDIYVCNYLIAPNYLWRNNHDGTFTDVAVEQGMAGKADIYNSQGPYYGHTAGAGWADFNNNGNLDLWVSNLAHKDDERSGYGRGYYCDDSMMLLNNGGPLFEFKDIRNRTGIPITPVGALVGVEWKDEDYFGVTWGDYDNDGDIDFWVPQVKTYHSWAYSYLWRNNNNETFTDDSDNAGLKVWSNTGAVWGDYNNDGFLDLLTEGTYPYQGKRETRLFENSGNSNNWLQLRLKGTISNTAAIGTRVLLTTGDITQLREIGGDAGGHGFQNSFTVEFGLGTSTTADEIKILWPSGIVQVLHNVAANQIINVTEVTTGPKINSISVSSYQALEDETLTFSASITGSISMIQWDFDNDGVIDSEFYGSYPPTNFKYTISGNHTAKVWIWDSQNELGWTETSKFIVVTNVLPTAVADSDRTIWEDQITIFDASQSYDTPTDSMHLEYNWSFGDGFYSGWMNSSSCQYLYPNEGTYIVTLMVRDDDHAVSSDTLTVTVKNKLPSCEIFAPASATEDSVVILKAICNDTPSDQPGLLSFWDFGDGNKTYWSSEHDVQHFYSNQGEYFVRCYIRDDNWPRDQNYSEVQIVIYNIDPDCWYEADTNVDEDEIVYFYAIGNDTSSDEPDLIYLWDFGDGSTTEWLQKGEQNVTYSYPQCGFYQVKLIVQDNNDAKCEEIINISVQNLPPTCTAMDETDLTIDEDTTIAFYGSGTDTKSDISTLEYSWSFGESDLSASAWNTSAEVHYTYRTSGEFKVILTVRDNDGDTDNSSFWINVRNINPTAMYQVSQITANEDEVIYFDGSDSFDTPTDLEVLNYSWNFKDKTTVQYGKKVQHVYEQAGEYRVELTVTDIEGKTDVFRQLIKIKNIKPTAVIIASHTEVFPKFAINFNGNDSSDTLSDLTSLKFNWDFGDNKQFDGKSVTHSYSEPGRYKVTLSVTDNDGSVGTATLDIRVKELPEDEDEKDNADRSQWNDFLFIIGIFVIILIIIILLIIFYLIKKSKTSKSSVEEVLDTSTTEVEFKEYLIVPEQMLPSETSIPDKTKIDTPSEVKQDSPGISDKSKLGELVKLGEHVELGKQVENKELKEREKMVQEEPTQDVQELEE